MNIALWVLQIILALHTAMGAIWKASNPAQAIPSLTMIPHGAWMAMAGLEILCAVGLAIPLLSARLAFAAPLAAALIALEMLVFSGLHLYSGQTEYGPMIYWLVVAALCVFVAYGRWKMSPVQ